MTSFNKQSINGVLLLDKPKGFSSNAVLQKVKYVYHAKKAGHTGTLDPLATGLLPICFGEATKLSSFLLDSAKEYVATVKLGTTTTTYDAEGDIVAVSDVAVEFEQLTEALKSFAGVISQKPPIYSALKVAGIPLYEYARRGEDVEAKIRQITIYKLELLNFALPDVFKIRVLASKGTYIRSLAYDIGVKLGCGAHLLELQRTKTSCFSIDGAISFDNLINMSESARLECLLPYDILVKHLTRVDITEEQLIKARHGNMFVLNKLPDTVKVAEITHTLQVRLYYANQFLGIANINCLQQVQPLRLINFDN